MLDIKKYAPMGWNSWDCYGAGVTEETVRKNAEFMAQNLLKYGWEYIVVDIQWSGPEAKTHEYIPNQELVMDEYGRLLPAENRFPSAKGGKGFKELADYVHSLGLKFGIHIMRGIPKRAVNLDLPVYRTKYTANDIAETDNICEWNPDMYGLNPKHEGAKAYYDSIFALYASWGVDFIKLDDICREMPRFADELELISDCLHSCGRDMVFSISPGPAVLEYSEFYKKTADMWRITDDFWDKWELLYAMFERAEKWSIHTGAGNWPDADMLPIGPILQDYDTANRTKFTKDEQITMMSLWAIFRSPLMIGGDMTGFDDFTMSLVTNKKILEMHKNARHSHQVWRRKEDGSEHILWAAASADGGNYAALFNTGDTESEICLKLSDLEIYSSDVRVTELWNGEIKGIDMIEGNPAVYLKMNPHGAAVLNLKML
ncbi:MAG: glycoside hydrolase family 27 protein [Eubacterium sp.]|nr:glycoside hydrolase family 27 protein [Eubacterium sp.]